MGWDSAGYEIGNALARGTFPAPRLKRPGPPPAGQAADFDPLALRGSPIRARNSAFAHVGSGVRTLTAFGPYVGPGLLKWIQFTHTNLNDTNPQTHWNIFHNTSPYVTSSTMPLTTLPPGTAVFNAVAARTDGFVYADEGGVTNAGQVVNSGRFLLDYYIPDAQFFIGVVVRQAGAGAGNLFGSLLVYEGVLPSDYPGILG